MISHYRQKLIETLIARDGGHCRYCKVEVRRNWLQERRYDYDATVDHVIPKSKGGPNHISNYAIACRKCNHAKADLSVAEFMALSPKTKKRAPRKPRPIQPIDFDHLLEATRKTVAGWQAAQAKADAMKKSAYTPPPKLSALELARALREHHGPWPLA